MRRALRTLSSILIVAGCLLIADAGITLAWQEPVSALYARITQDRLGSDLRALERKRLTELQLRALARLRGEQRRVAFLARALRHTLKTGDPIGRISIPRIASSFVVVQGTDGATLKKGPGHYPDTPLPGLPGTVAIAGHRTTYLAPFRRINDLHSGDEVTIEMPYARFTYRIERTRIVKPTEYSVTRPVGHNRLVLTACHPLYSAKQRIVVFAREVGVEARGAARLNGT
jgi:sortase A